MPTTLTLWSPKATQAQCARHEQGLAYVASLAGLFVISASRQTPKNEGDPGGP